MLKLIATTTHFLLTAVWSKRKEKVTISAILRKKAKYPVRLIAQDNDEYKMYESGDEVGIEEIDFSCKSLRCINKHPDRPNIFEIRYNEKTGELTSKWEFKPCKK